ncbi:MAG: deoxyribose-phosphate aldolase [Erysipelotrichia bacterium]|nr:deoxyribose-phosphate aldolase [Erysipelotrichia bacterium]
MNKLIDHTLLKADATKEAITKLCEEAKQYDFASVCVNSGWVAYCAKYLQDCDVKVCSVVGFPLGAMSSKAKAFETKCVIEDGGDEIDMVMNIGALKDRDDDLVLADIKAVVAAAQGHCVKVILETCLLTQEEIVRACKLCVEANATFVKTSTGFSTRGAVIEDVKLMKDTVQDKALVKAAGGVRNMADLKAMVEAGASRIGTSSGVALMQDKEANNAY